MSEDFINVNLEDVDDGREPMPEGVVSCVVKNAEWARKEGGEFPFMKLELKPATGSVDEKFKNKSLFLNLSLHPKALWNMKLFFKAVKMPLDLRNMKKEEIARSLVGRDVRVTVGVATSNQNPEEKVNDVKPPYHSV